MSKVIVVLLIFLLTACGSNENEKPIKESYNELFCEFKTESDQNTYSIKYIFSLEEDKATSFKQMAKTKYFNQDDYLNAYYILSSFDKGQLYQDINGVNYSLSQNDHEFTIYEDLTSKLATLTNEELLRLMPIFNEGEISLESSSLKDRLESMQYQCNYQNNSNN